MRHDDAGHVRAELLVGGEAHGVTAEEAEELGILFCAVDEGIDATGLGEEAALDGDGVAEFGADFGFPGGLVAGKRAGGEVCGWGGFAQGKGGRGGGFLRGQFCAGVFHGGEDGGGGEVARDHGEVNAFSGEGVDHAGGVSGEQDAVGVGAVERAGNGDGEGAVVFPGARCRWRSRGTSSLRQRRGGARGSGRGRARQSSRGRSRSRG